MAGRKYFFMAALLSTVVACSSGDTCDDLKGVVTHADIEITGIKSATLATRHSDSNVLEAIDPIGGASYSNLIMQIDLSWVEEQFRFREPNTFIQSMLDWFVSPAMACSLPPYYETFTPEVASIEMYSDSDLNDAYVAGSNLASVFAAPDAINDNGSLVDAADSDGLMPARSYTLEPLWLDGALATTPITPRRHIFTILLTLKDGRAFEVRTQEILLSTI